MNPPRSNTKTYTIKYVIPLVSSEIIYYGA